jgi:nucleotide-binding universal stress UspA family protein
MSTIVVGYVPKPEGRAAIHRAAAEAKLRSSTMIVVNSAKGGREFESEEAVRIEEAMKQIREELEEAGIGFETRQLVRGMDVAEDLIAVAEESGAEMIVIGLRRRSPVGKLILGSNAQTILLDAPCPVLAVKAEEDEE